MTWNRNLAIGIFTVTGTALFFAAVFLIGTQHGVFAKHFDVCADFRNLNGLTKGAKVRVAGFDAGQVKEISIPSSPSAGFHLKMEINDKMRGLIRTDSVAAIATAGVVGETYVLIGAGSPSAPQAAPLSTIPSRQASDISDLLDKSTALVGNANEILSSVSNRLNTALDAITTTVDNADDLVVGLKQGRGAIGMLLRDEKTATEIRDAIASVRDATSSLNHASAQADSMVSDFRSRNLPAKIDGIVTDFQSREFGQKLDDTIGGVQVAVSNVGATTQQLQNAVDRALAPDARGKDAADNIRETLSNANQATGNLVDDTEAIKHEFFFRGYFKHRGYYSLQDLTPEAYRRDKVFTNPKNPRAWIAAGELFERKPGEAETLSRAGEARIDAAVAQFGDRALGALVVEGYAVSDSPGDALAVSNARAALVRNYLHRRFRLDDRRIGTVALRDVPPPTSRKDTWNGICLVLLARA